MKKNLFLVTLVISLGLSNLNSQYAYSTESELLEDYFKRIQNGEEDFKPLMFISGLGASLSLRMGMMATYASWNGQKEIMCSIENSDRASFDEYNN